MRALAGIIYITINFKYVAYQHAQTTPLELVAHPVIVMMICITG